MKVDFSKLKFPMSWKAFTQVCILIGLLTVFVYYGGQATINMDVQYRINVIALELEELEDALLKLNSTEGVESLLRQYINSSFSLLSKPYSAWIEKVGSYTCYGNGTNGHLEAYDTNSTQIFSWVEGNLTSGGSIFIKRASTRYLIDGLVNCTNHNIMIDSDGAILKRNANTTVFLLYNVENWTISNIIFDGNKANFANADDLIEIDDSKHITITNCKFYSSPQYAIYANDGDQQLEDIEVSNCYFTNNKWVMLIQGYSALYHRPSFIRIQNNIVISNGGKIGISSCKYISVCDNHIENNGLGITVQGSYETEIHDNIINKTTDSGNEAIFIKGTGAIPSNITEIHDNLIVNSAHGAIGSQAQPENIYVHDNICHDNVQTDIAVLDATSIIEHNIVDSNNDISTNGRIRYNIGYVTENSGTQTCADNENIAHGLAGTPTTVHVDSMNITYDAVPVIVNVDWTGVDATNINIGLYWVNGTAITDDVILLSWSAEYHP